MARQPIQLPTVSRCAASTDHVTDAELVERARAGDADAFGDLVERYQAVVYRAARAALRSPVDADDVVQEAFVAAFRKLAEFRAEAGFKTWLLAIAWNAARMHRRSSWRWFDRFRPAPGPTPPDPAAQDRSQEDVLVRRDLRERVQKAALTLPGKYRDVMLLAATADHTVDEISAILGVPPGTVKWRLAKGREQLRVKLTRLGIRHD
jgi:RNA polymerase sigma-70 factor (ECF subfamily)